jgi:DedD protein
MATRSPSAKRNGALDPALPQKKRARRRLIGATALCLLAAVVLPIVLDAEPRRPRDEIQVRIPSRDTPGSEGAPLQPSAATRPAEADSVANSQSGPSDARSAMGVDGSPGSQRPEAQGRKPGPVKPDASLDGSAPPSEREAEARKAPKTDGSVASRIDPLPDSRADRKSDPKPETRPDPKSDPISRLAEARSGPGATRPGTYLLQTGAYASESAASEQLERLRSAGVSAYTEKVQTTQGERIRVRAGPFPNRESAEKARARLKSAGIEAAMIAPAEGR